MKTIVRIGNSDDSKKILIKGVVKIIKGRIYHKCILGNEDENEFYVVKEHYNPNTPFAGEIIPRKETTYFVECKPEESTLVEANGITHDCIHIGDDKFMMFERVALWDNTITGLNCISHTELGKYGSTVFKIGETAKNVTYFKNVSKEDYYKLQEKYT